MNIAVASPEMSTRRLFLGVEHSACGRAWRDRLDERGAARALAIAQRHDNVPELLARILAGRGVAAEEVEGFLDPTVRALMPDPHTLADMPAAAVAHRRRDGARRDRRDLRRLRCRWRDLGGDAGALSAPRRTRPADPYPRPDFRRLRPQRGGGARARRPGRDAARDGRLRHHQPRAARRGEAARPRRHRDRPSPRRRGAAARAGGGQSQPARRSLRPRPSRGGRPGVHDRGGGQPRTARARFLDGGTAGARPARRAASGRARHGGRRRAAQGPQPRLRHQGPVGAAPARTSRAYRADGCRAAWRAARALASRVPARAAHQCRRAHRARDARRRPAAAGRSDPRPGVSPTNSTASTASAR